MAYTGPQGGAIGWFDEITTSLTDWWIKDPSGTTIAQQSSPEGWTVTVSPYFYPPTGILTYEKYVTIPLTAVVEDGYTLKIFPSGNEYLLNVIPASGGGGGGSGRRRAQVCWIMT